MMNLAFKKSFVVGAIVIVGLGLAGCKKKTVEGLTSSVQSTDSGSGFNFNNPKKSAHYESNTPQHGAVLAGVPVNVLINFNFDLAKPSEISTKNNGKEYGVGGTVIDNNKLAMRRNIDPAAPDGVYMVSYNACWPDGSCHDGSFEFAIDKSKSTSFRDLTNQKEVTISMSQIMFDPIDIIISKQTKVTWVNDDDTTHYVNTDSHPAHTYFLEQNSKALNKGDLYSVTFDQAGIYPYHCSAHEATMKGNILVN